MPARPGLRRPAVVLAAVVVLAAGGAGSCDPEDDKPTVDASRRAPSAPTGSVLRASFQIRLNMARPSRSLMYCGSIQAP